MKIIPIKFNRILAGFFSVVLVFFIVCSISLPCFAVKSSTNNVRVGWFLVDHAQERDKDGNPCGFIYDCLTRLSQVTGLTYEFVDCTAQESTEMLKTGELDMMFFLRYLPEREEFAYFADVPICTISMGLYCLDSKVSEYTDISSVDGKKIAVNAGSAQKKKYAALAEESGVSVSFLEVANSKEAISAIQLGQADYALIDSLSDVPNNFCKLDYFDAGHSYPVISGKRADLLKVVNQGLSMIIESDPDFFTSTYNTYFGSDNNSDFYLTSSEKEAISKLGTLRVYVSETNGYLSRLENGEYKGIRVDITKRIAQSLSIPYEFVKVENMADLLDWQKNTNIDFISGFFFDYNWANQNKVQLTKPYLSQNYFCLKKKKQ